jgi:hypothetical protein
MLSIIEILIIAPNAGTSSEMQEVFRKLSAELLLPGGAF